MFETYLLMVLEFENEASRFSLSVPGRWAFANFGPSLRILELSKGFSQMVQKLKHSGAPRQETSVNNMLSLQFLRLLLIVISLKVYETRQSQGGFIKIFL